MMALSSVRITTIGGCFSLYMKFCLFLILLTLSSCSPEAMNRFLPYHRFTARTWVDDQPGATEIEKIGMHDGCMTAMKLRMNSAMVRDAGEFIINSEYVHDSSYTKAYSIGSTYCHLLYTYSISSPYLGSRDPLGPKGDVISYMK
jgi:hypothetical protein